MAGKLKIHVDQDKCQGHARCKSLAPRTVRARRIRQCARNRRRHRARGARGQGLARQSQLSGNRDRRDRGMNLLRCKRPAGPAPVIERRPARGNCPDVRFRRSCPNILRSPTGSTISTTPIRAGPKIRFRSGTNCARHRPVVHTDRFLGCYLPTTYEAVQRDRPRHRAFLLAPRHRARRPAGADRNAAPPITSDPPEHKPAKQLLLPPFTPDAMKKLEPRVRAICNELIDEFIADGKCDAAARYTKHIPVRAIAHMLGIPEKDGDLFIKWIHEILELGIKDDEHADARGPGDDRLFRRPYRARARRIRPTT